jgi:Rieske Fe-S protein
MDEPRRHFIKGAISIALGSVFLALGTCNKLFNFFFGPRLSESEEKDLMSAKLEHLQSTIELRKLELERETNKFIAVATLSDLSDTNGKYFIDYEMRPAIALAGKDGLPILISAKCTHLGCTVGNQVNNEGKILCPCHVSYFDVVTGKPNADAPAKTPLPHLAWVIMDEKNNQLAARTKQGVTTGSVPESQRSKARVLISKEEVRA